MTYLNIRTNFMDHETKAKVEQALAEVRSGFFSTAARDLVIASIARDNHPNYELCEDDGNSTHSHT